MENPKANGGTGSQIRNYHASENVVNVDTIGRNSMSIQEFADRNTRWTDWMVNCLLAKRWIYSSEFHPIKEDDAIDGVKLAAWLKTAY